MSIWKANKHVQVLRQVAIALIICMVVGGGAHAAQIELTTSRATLVKTPRPMGEVLVADPSIADVHANGNTYLSVIGKRPGITSLRIFDNSRQLIQSYDVRVGYDLVEMRRALKNFLPDELIAVEMVGDNVALTGTVSSAENADKAVRIVSEILKSTKGPAAAQPAAAPSPLASLFGGAASEPESNVTSGVLNLLQVSNNQQVMLRVRVGEIQRSALKALGVNLNGLVGSARNPIGWATGAAGLTGFLSPAEIADNAIARGPGTFIFPADGAGVPINTQGILTGTWRPSGANGPTLAGALQALERDGLFKLLAEPNLVAMSGQEAQFLAGGEIPIPIPQSTSGTTPTITIEYKPYGVAVKFRPTVLSERRIRMDVQPEVSELDRANALTLQGFSIPAITTRRANTTVELAPGEGFMIAGLIKDDARTTIDQLPGIKELPILGALFRSTNFQRNETELVIAVTPYTVDPTKGADVQLPTDNFAPASDMEMYFYGALGSLQGGKAARIAQSPSVEGPIGFMAD